MRQFLLVIFALLFLFAPVAADGLIHQLPPDGSFVVYNLEVINKRGDKVDKQKGQIRLSSVGKANADGQACRWIEMKSVVTEGVKGGLVVKLLIPEKHLKPGQAPLDHVVKAWVMPDRVKPLEIKDVDMIRSPLTTLAFGGPLTDAKKLPKATIDSGLGKLECDGIKGLIDIEGGEAIVETRLHEKSPFGVVHMRAEGKEKGELLTFTLTDVGTGAKSEISEPK